MKLRILLLFIVVLTLASGGLTQTTDKADEALKTLVRQMVDAQLTYDSSTLDRIFATDYIEISPVGEFDPRAKVLSFYKPSSRPDPTSFSATAKVTEDSIRHYGDFAIVIAKFDYDITANGKPAPPRSIRATIVCRKSKNGWKIVSAHYTGIRPPKPQ